jgi:hypothetical protein
MKGGINMKKENKNIFGKIATGLLAIVIVGGIGMYAVPNEVEVLSEPVMIPGETIYEEVLVDNGNLELVLDHIYDDNGDMNYLLDDLDDDEVEQIVDRIVFVNEAKTLAANYIKSEIADLLDKEEVGEIKLDEDDIKRIRIDSDDDEMEIEDIDFEDKDAHVLINATFKQDDASYKVSFDVEIKENEVDDVEMKVSKK